jgi:hypothetical protein
MKNLKQFIKNHNRILNLLAIFKDSEGRIEIAKRFTKLNDFAFNSNKESIEIKLNDIDYCNIDDAILNLEIINKDTIEQIKENVNEEDSCQHANDNLFEDFGCFDDSFYKKFYYKKFDYSKEKEVLEKNFEFTDWGYGQSGITSENFELDNKFWQQDFCTYYLDELTPINNYQDLIRNVRIYNKFDNDIIGGQRGFLSDSYHYIKNFVYDLRAMLSVVKIHNESAETIAQEQLECDIEDFIENENLLKDGDIEKVKFDYIAKIEGEEIITNKGAKAPLDDCKKALEVFKSGGSLEGLKLGVYTINKIFNIKENVFFRAGCHLVRIDDNLINQLA